MEQVDGVGEVPVPSQHWLVTLLLLWFSLGLYIPIWLDRFNKSLGKQRVARGMITALFLFIGLSIGIDLLKFIFLHVGIDSMISLVTFGLFSWLVSIVVFILAIVAAFSARDVLQEVYGEKFNGVGTFFFNVFFLQIRINTLNKRRGVPWGFNKEDLRVLGLFFLIYAAYMALLLTVPESSLAAMP